MENQTKLTGPQKRILLVLCNAFEKYESVRLRVTQDNYHPIRETTTAAALARKGLARRTKNGQYTITNKGYWLKVGLQIEDRQGKIPPRRRVENK